MLEYWWIETVHITRKLLGRFEAVHHWGEISQDAQTAMSEDLHP